MTIVIIAAVIGLYRFGSYVSRHAQKRELPRSAEWFLVIRAEALHLWLPQTLIELAKRHAQSAFIRIHEQLQQFRELQHQKELWYALTVRVYQGAGTDPGK